jgi:NADH-quinone oxidoreductase subunit L
VLRNAWYVDHGLASFMGGPGRWAADRMADVVDARVVDGAVNGVATLVRGAGTGLRRVQTGFVRNYALAVAGGVVLVLGFMVARAGVV